MSLDLLAELDDLDGGSDEEVEEEQAPLNVVKRSREEMEEDGAEGDEDDEMDDEQDEEAQKKSLEAVLAEKLKGADDVKAVAKLLHSKGFQDTLKVRRSTRLGFGSSF
jgi:hypothetical protein